MTDANKKAEADASVAEWKARREAHKLERRADDAEDHAIESLYDARVAVDKAIAAVVEAAIARLDADDVSREVDAKDAPKS